MTPARIRLLTFVAVLVAAVGFAASASAQTCAENIIDDWADNAEIDGTYPLDCYRSAIQALPEDLRAYSSAGDDIRRAQQELIAAQSDSGGGSESSGGGESAGSGGSDGGGSSETVERDPQGETQAQDTLSGVTENESPPPSEGLDEEAEVGSETTAAPDAAAFGEELGDGGSSLPVPIIVLLAVAGVAAVSVAGWLIVRQLRARGDG
jgi:hypothetical protein